MNLPKLNSKTTGFVLTFENKSEKAVDLLIEVIKKFECCFAGEDVNGTILSINEDMHKSYFFRKSPRNSKWKLTYLKEFIKEETTINHMKDSQPLRVYNLNKIKNKSLINYL